MTRADASRIAKQLYAEHAEAAESLIVQAADTRPTEARERAARALRCLDPDEPFSSSPVSEFARGIATLVCGAVHAADYGERVRLAGLLDAILVEADSLRRRSRELAA